MFVQAVFIFSFDTQNWRNINKSKNKILFFGSPLTTYLNYPRSFSFLQFLDFFFINIIWYLFFWFTIFAASLTVAGFNEFLIDGFYFWQLYIEVHQI